jgi:2-polyprenyl-3-methyl-5-hydroxy-6-metoxy-1,4-benzoquinol methylase
VSEKGCWCGSTRLLDYSPDYQRCGACGTLLTRHGPTGDLARVQDDSRDFYGRDYWFTHHPDDLGYPTITERARSDLAERCIYWLRALLQHRLPPGKILELGAAHGGFVSLLHEVGFDATGQELSPAIVELARSTFAVPMLQGPIEDQVIPEQSLDVIALFDVMEHFQDPVGTLRHCLKLLKPDGFLLVQTPRVPTDVSYEDLVARKDPFLAQFKKDEHLYLFSETGVSQFFRDLGAPEIAFMPAIYSQYDMFFTAGRLARATFTEPEIAEALCAKGHRLVLALLDLYAQHRKATRYLATVERDSDARLQLINTLDARLRALESQPVRTGRAVGRVLGRWLSGIAGSRRKPRARVGREEQPEP